MKIRVFSQYIPLQCSWMKKEPKKKKKTTEYVVKNDAHIYFYVPTALYIYMLVCNCVRVRWSTCAEKSVEVLLQSSQRNPLGAHLQCRATQSLEAGWWWRILAIHYCHNCNNNDKKNHEISKVSPFSMLVCSFMVQPLKKY